MSTKAIIKYKTGLIYLCKDLGINADKLLLALLSKGMHDVEVIAIGEDTPIFKQLLIEQTGKEKL